MDVASPPCSPPPPPPSLRNMAIRASHSRSRGEGRCNFAVCGVSSNFSRGLILVRPRRLISFPLTFHERQMTLKEGGGCFLFPFHGSIPMHHPKSTPFHLVNSLRQSTGWRFICPRIHQFHHPFSLLFSPSSVLPIRLQSASAICRLFCRFTIMVSHMLKLYLRALPRSRNPLSESLRQNAMCFRIGFCNAAFVEADSLFTPSPLPFPRWFIPFPGESE